MTSEITIQDLELLLRSKGFTEADRNGLNRRFTHRASGATVSLPTKARARALPVFLSAVQFVLDQWRLMKREKFDEWRWRLELSRKDKAAAGRAGKSADAGGNGSAKSRARSHAHRRSRSVTTASS